MMCKELICDFYYLSKIIIAVEAFYKNDYELLLPQRATHEQTVSFRIGMYLAQLLHGDPRSFYVDCEYHGDRYNSDLRKRVQGKRIRPDIVYHDRGLKNEFCIEMKIRSLVSRDYDKLRGLIKEYGFREGYGICNIGQNFVTIYAFSEKCLGDGVKYRFYYNRQKQKLELTRDR